MAGEEGKSGVVGALARGGVLEAPGAEAGLREGDRGMAGRGPWWIEDWGGRTHRVASNHPVHPR